MSNIALSKRIKLTMRTFMFIAFFSQPFVFAAENNPDFSGVWELEGWSADQWNLEPPYTPAGKAAQDAWAEDPLSDPSNLCVFNLVRITSAPLPHEIIQQEERVTLLYEYQHQVRRAFMDGRGLSESSYPTLMGFSIGKWEGETLVIETVALEAGYLRPQGKPHSASLKVIERRTLLENGDAKSLEMTIIDPEYYTEPWTITTQWRKTDSEILDYDCIVRSHLPAVQ